MTVRNGAVAALLMLTIAVLASCAPGDGDAGSSPSASTGTGSSPATASEPTPGSTLGPTPSPTPIALPTDCRAILSADVLTQLKDVPLNDPAFGESGVLGDGTLLCVWGDPGADTTSLVTRIERMPRGEALDMLNGLTSDGFSCFTPSGGTRCEKTWANEQYPVTDGRTLFWRDGVLIDTRYSNLAPSGYTNSIIASLWK